MLETTHSLHWLLDWAERSLASRCVASFSLLKKLKCTSIVWAHLLLPTRTKAERSRPRKCSKLVNGLQHVDIPPHGAWYIQGLKHVGDEQWRKNCNFDLHLYEPGSWEQEKADYPRKGTLASIFIFWMMNANAVQT